MCSQMSRRLLLLIPLLCTANAAWALDRPETPFQVYQFPANAIPRIDGKTDDWQVVPENYWVGTDKLQDLASQLKPDPKNLNVKVKVGWVAGLNRLYFLYEAQDDNWQFDRRDLRNDMFEVVIDGDLSGGPFISNMHPDEKVAPWALYQATHGVHAQNWHIFTPALDKDWVMMWGCPRPWIRTLPYANAAYAHNVQHGKSGKLVLEFFITPFDHASCEGPGRSVESQMTEDKQIGLGWAVKDYDDPNSGNSAFWSLTRKITMYGNASDLTVFRLMPLEPRWRKPIEAQWSFTILNPKARDVAFRDLSYGPVQNWLWDFGDGTTSAEQHPTHHFEKGGEFVVTLSVAGPAGKARLTKVWDVVLER